MNEQGDKQRNPQLWLLSDSAPTRSERVAEVALRLRTRRIHVFAVPQTLLARISIGSMVRVRHGKGRREVDGWVISLSDKPWDTTRRPIDEVLVSEPLVDESLIRLALWIAEYYACPPGYVCEAMIPAPLRKQKLRLVRYARRTDTPPPEKLRATLRAALDAIPSGEWRREQLLARAAIRPATLATLARHGLVQLFERREAVEGGDPAGESAAVVEFAATPEDDFDLTAGQRDALAAIVAALAPQPRFEAQLLYGVPGSGKTEVYVRAIREAVRLGRQAILLIPEIALATQLAERLARRFPRAAVLHSRLKESERLRVLRAVAAGEIDVVIGTRTAVFAPCRRLGLIIVDEEQETSYKSIAAPYYHARDAAIKRGQIVGVPVVLGSATPALESWYNANHLSHFRLLRLAERVPGAEFPSARRIDTSRRELGQTTMLLAPELIDALRDTLAGGAQAILLHNRRGYAANLRCKECGLVLRCERCGAALVEHRADGQVKCHHCGRATPIPPRCIDSTCGGELERVGAGIQRLEEELKRVAPTALVLRLDSDTMRRREDYAATLQAFERREADVLLGTQMVAKGLDFPDVRLVGVLDADAALSLPDFRAPERVFQLLMQVAGRAGRRAGASLVLAQSAADPDGVVSDALARDYESFAAKQLAIRRENHDPPFGRLIRVVVSDERASQAQTATDQIVAALREIGGRIHAAIRVRDAGPCAVKRLRGMARFETVVSTPREVGGVRLLHEADRRRAFRVDAKRVIVDVDPIDML